MSKLRLVLLIALCAVWPATARAQSDFIDWLQQQSGPGPYHTYFKGYEIRAYCPKANEKYDLRRVWDCFLDDPDLTKWVLSFDTTYAKTYNRRLFLDDPSDVREISQDRYTIAFVYRPNIYLKVGGTFDLLRFSSDQGNAFSFWKVGFGPRLIVSPFARHITDRNTKHSGSLHRLIQLQIDAPYVPQGFKATDFNNTVSKFESGPEFQVRTSLVIDSSALLRAIHP